MVHEYTTEDFIEAIREEAFEKGMEIGRQKLLRTAEKLRIMGLSAEQVAEAVELA